jgi:xanthine dehydrogenase accessory factor
MMPYPSSAPEALSQLDRLRHTEHRVAMATLISTEGTTPRKEGAKMWVGEGGRILGSVTIGGCVDAQVIAESERVLASAQSSVLSLSLRDDQGWDMGLTCGGTLRVLIEPIALDTTHPAVVAYDEVRAEWEAGRRAVTVSLVTGDGARLVVREDGTTAGTLGDPELNAAARVSALEALRDGSSRALRVGAGLHGGELFFEVYGPPVRLLVFGATHVAAPLVRLAAGLGWHTTVIDARERFATRERLPDADEILVGDVEDLACRQRYDATTFVAIVAHDYKFELPILRVVLAHEPAYIGLLASRTRARTLRDYLAAEGIDPSVLTRVHAPIGLDIGAQSAAEIALSVMAEMVATYRRRPGSIAGDLVGRAKVTPSARDSARVAESEGVAHAQRGSDGLSGL